MAYGITAAEAGLAFIASQAECRGTTDTARVAIRGMFRRRQRGAVTRERGELLEERDPPLYMYTASGRGTRKSPVVAGEQRCGET